MMHRPQTISIVIGIAVAAGLAQPAHAQLLQAAPPAQQLPGASAVAVAGTRLWTDSNDLNVLPGLLRSLCVGTAFGQYGCPGGWEFGAGLAGPETPITVRGDGGEGASPGVLPANRYVYPRTAVMGEAVTARPRNGTSSNGTRALAPRRPS